MGALSRGYGNIIIFPCLIMLQKGIVTVYRDNQHIRIILYLVHLYACFLSTILPVLMNRSCSITQPDEKSKHRDVYYTYVLIIPILLFLVCYLALPSLLHFSILSYCFFLY